MSSTISALTNGTTVQSTDRIPAARSPYAPGDNVYLTPDELKAYATSPITIAFADVATETSAGNLIDGQMYNITGFPAFASGIQLVNLEFRAHLVTAAGYAVMSMEGVAYDSGTNLQIGLTVDWYTSGSPAIGVVVPYLWNELRHTDNVAFGNEIDMLKWNDATKVYRSTINDLQINNFDEVADSLVITNSFIQSGSSIDMAGFTGLVLDHVNLGFACSIIVTADSITCQDIRTGSNNTIYLPGNGINGGIWGSGNVIGAVGLGFSQFDNITMGNDNDITPDIDGTWSIQNCEWGDKKTHVIKSSFDGAAWISDSSSFAYLSDMSNDVSVGGAWTIPDGYGVILMAGAAAANVVSILQSSNLTRLCKNSGSSAVILDTSGSGFSISTVPVNTAGDLAVGSAVTTLTLGSNDLDNFTVEMDSVLGKPIIKNINLY